MSKTDREQGNSLTDAKSIKEQLDGGAAGDERSRKKTLRDREIDYGQQPEFVNTANPGPQGSIRSKDDPLN